MNVVDDFISLLQEVPEDPESLLADLRNLPAKSRAHILMQLLGRSWDDMGKALSRSEKHDAIDIATVLGPDNCQDLYRLAVFLTKVA